ncbi:MAG: hypothetical protein IPO72_19105 [Saprospiraceae bacterium]|nr:hypothetical protein [Candidatus Vicinibacter affinis]
MKVLTFAGAGGVVGFSAGLWCFGALIDHGQQHLNLIIESTVLVGDIQQCDENFC